MSSVYVLMEEGWEYNDETYFHPESGSGTPTKVFDTAEAAAVECSKRNLESFKSMFTEGDAGQYFYNINDILPYSGRKNGENIERLDQLSNLIFGCDLGQLNDQLDYQHKIATNPDVSDTTWAEFQSMTTMIFWTVVECEKE